MISFLNPVPALPPYPGPFKVGSVEYEIPVSEISTDGPLPDPRITTVKFRLFYPTTATASTKQSIPWLPTPQRQWTEAYASFIGAGPGLSSLLGSLPSLISYTTIPAVPNAPLPQQSSPTYPVVVFSHGLGGNDNAYSSVCGSLASCGIVCAAPEHRDGSAPVSLIRSRTGHETTSIPYQRHSHSPTVEVLNARNAQLRIRLWELGLLYSVLAGLNAGQTFSNCSASPDQDFPSFQDTLDLRPGRVTWAGHSFGAATVVQFVKSVYHHQSLPCLKNTPHENDEHWQPLFTPGNGSLLKQITAQSPMALLDLWVMPLRTESTNWLWEKPLPCHDRDPSQSDGQPNVVAVMSSEFFKWKEMVNWTRAALSARPAEAIQNLEEQKYDSPSDSELNPAPSSATDLSTGLSVAVNEIDGDPGASTSPAISAFSSRSSSPSPPSSPASSTTSLSASIPPSTPAPTFPPTSHPKLFVVPRSAHLSQSDFGVLFPTLIRYLKNADHPEHIINLNVRAILAVMRGSGLDVARIGVNKSQSQSQAYMPPAGDENDQGQAEDEDEILSGTLLEERWIPVSLTG